MDITKYISANINADIYTSRLNDIEYTIITTSTTWQRIRTDKIYGFCITEADDAEPTTLEIFHEAGEIKVII